MQNTRRRHPLAASIFALTSTSAVGFWFGFASCGGYVWHDYICYATVATATLAIFLYGPKSKIKRLGLILLIVIVFFVARGVGFAAYLDAGSPAEYLRAIGRTFDYGLC